MYNVTNTYECSAVPTVYAEKTFCQELWTGIGNYGRVGDMNNFPSSPFVIFLGGAISIGISVLLLPSTWRTVMAIIETIPHNYRRAFYKNLRRVTDRLVKAKLELLESLLIICVFFGLSIACSVFAMLEASAYMLGLRESTAAIQYQDLNLTRNLFIGAFIFLASAMYGIALIRILELLYALRGRESPLYYIPQTKDDQQRYEAEFEVAIGIRGVLPEPERRVPWDQGTWTFFLFLVGAYIAIYWAVVSVAFPQFCIGGRIALFFVGLLAIWALVWWRSAGFYELWSRLRRIFTRRT